MSDGGPLVWDDAYAVGDAQIDAQHRRLFALVNSLIGLEEGQRAAYLKLQEDFRSHFSHEESLMRRIGYPGLLDHQSEHDQLSGLLTASRIEIVGGDWTIDAMCAFFSRWMVEHIAKHDRALVSYMRSTAAGGSKTSEH